MTAPVHDDNARAGGQHRVKPMDAAESSKDNICIKPVKQMAACKLIAQKVYLFLATTYFFENESGFLQSVYLRLLHYDVILSRSDEYQFSHGCPHILYNSHNRSCLEQAFTIVLQTLEYRYSNVLLPYFSSGQGYNGIFII